MTVCARCGERFERSSTRGPEPKYCSQVCRQRAYETRQTDALVVHNELLCSTLRKLVDSQVIDLASLPFVHDGSDGYKQVELSDHEAAAVRAAMTPA